MDGRKTRKARQLPRVEEDRKVQKFPVVEKARVKSQVQNVREDRQQDKKMSQKYVKGKLDFL
jgi:hypothetical protein